MASLTDCFKIHFDAKDEADKFVISLIKRQAKSIAGKKRISKVVAQKAVQDVIGEYESDSKFIDEQLRALVPEKVEPIVAPKEPVAPEVKGVIRMTTGEVLSDPDRFQYKTGMGRGGEGASEFEGVREFDEDLGGVLSVWMDVDGKTYVVNGHRRMGIARKTNAEFVDVRYLKEKTAKEAYVKGALINIAKVTEPPKMPQLFSLPKG